MTKKFKPEVSRVKLNPEQAVLACKCWQGRRTKGGNRNQLSPWCVENTRSTQLTCKNRGANSVS